MPKRKNLPSLPSGAQSYDAHHVLTHIVNVGAGFDLRNLYGLDLMVNANWRVDLRNQGGFHIRTYQYLLPVFIIVVG
ncbi:hypothetical protein D3C85_995880 [compost metagenome]